MIPSICDSPDMSQQLSQNVPEFNVKINESHGVASADLLSLVIFFMELICRCIPWPDSDVNFPPPGNCLRVAKGACPI